MSSTPVADQSSMGTTSIADKGMVKVMVMVMVALVMFALFCVLMARLLGVASSDESSAIMRNALVQRIEPVGRVRTSADDLPASQQAGAAPAGGEQVASAKTGDELVEGACASCHAAGVAGAPKTDDAAAWEERREAGLDALVASVINGKGAMPARGGSSYSDEEIKLAVQYLAGFEVEEPAAAEGDDKSAGAAEDDGGDMAAADEAGKGEEATAKQADGDVDLVAMIGSGEAPEGMSDNVKTAVDGVCAGCHVAGLANAPKLGDKKAWAPRAESGLAALTTSVNNGKAAMPAKGGSQLSEDEISVAIQYLISKKGS